MIKLALTGSIGMGKSATAAMFAARGLPVYDADAAVHAAYGPGGEAAAPLEWHFPGVMRGDGGIDRALLRGKVLNRPDAMKKLESIVHPIVGGMQKAFLEKAGASGADIVVLDIPLLFETGGDARADAILVVTAPAAVQRARVLARGMAPADFEAILARQTPDAEKRRRADFVINTGLGFAYAEAQVDAVIAALRSGGRARYAGKPASAESPGGASGPDSCAKSSSTPKPPGSNPTTATASSKSAASNSWT
jgi:dephospho-CoA kinase